MANGSAGRGVEFVRYQVDEISSSPPTAYAIARCSAVPGRKLIRIVTGNKEASKCIGISDERQSVTELEQNQISGNQPFSQRTWPAPVHEWDNRQQTQQKPGPTHPKEIEYGIHP